MSSGNHSIVTNHCEHEFWELDIGFSLPGWFSEPFSVVSGLLMIVLALKCTAGLDDLPLQFCVARASLLVCGLGTAAYHMLDQNFMDETRINGIMLDGVTMGMVTVNLFLMHLSDWMKAHLMSVSVLSMLYLLFCAVTNDMKLFTFLSNEWSVNGVSLLSIGIQYPLFVLFYVYIIVRVYWIHGINDIFPMWFSLFIALVSWVTNQFGCSYVRLFFIGHVVWHICIGYVAVYLMVLGLLNDYDDLEIKTDPCDIWVEVQITARGNRLSCNMDTSNFFNPAHQSKRYQRLRLG
jgi:hypothetical protein